MFKTIKTYLKELGYFRNLHFECIRAADNLGMNVTDLQKDYDRHSERQARFESDYNKILTGKMPLVIGIAGNFNAGKSSFINSVIGSDQLGVKEQPATCKVAVISYHEGPLPRFYKVYKDGKVMETDRAEYIRFGVHANRTAEEKEAVGKISHFEIKYRAEILQEIQLVDTPGFSTISKEDDRTAEEHLRKTDMLIWVFDGTKGSPDKGEVDRLRTLGKKNIVAVINRIDNQAPGERPAVIDTFKNVFEFLRVIPYSATEAFDQLMAIQENEQAFNRILEKARELRSANKDFIIGSKAGIYYITDSKDDYLEVKHKEIREDEYAEFYRVLIAEIRRLRREITEIKEELFRQELIAYHQQEIGYWREFTGQLDRTISRLQKDQHEFSELLVKLKANLTTRFHEHYKRFVDVILEDVYNALFYFHHVAGNWYTTEENSLKMRGTDEKTLDKVKRIIASQFNTFKDNLSEDMEKGLEHAEIELTPGPETEMVGILQEKFSTASYESVYGAAHLWLDRKLGSNPQEAKDGVRYVLNMLISSDHFANMALYCLNEVYERIFNQNKAVFDASHEALEELSKKIITVLKQEVINE
jgi:GTPase SAR1 family protein